MMPMTGPINLTDNPRGLETAKPIMHFTVTADDGTEFSATADQLELVK